MTISDDLRMKAEAVQSAVVQSLLNAWKNPAEESKWRKQADKLEAKFTSEHGRHYSYFLKYEDK